MDFSALSQVHSLEDIIRWGGTILLFFIIFAESGLFFGFFLPGDSLLFTAGLLAASGYFNIWVLLPLLIFAAILGDQVGYWTGHHLGKRLFKSKNNKFFRHDHLLKAEKYYEKHGPKTIVLARFIPIIRTFAPIVAGIGSMKYRKFVMYNVFGGFLWVLLMCSAGYLLVTYIPGIKNYLTYVILLVIIISFIPVGLEYWRQKLHEKKTR